MIDRGTDQRGNCSNSGTRNNNGRGHHLLDSHPGSQWNYPVATATTSFTVAQGVPTLTFAAIPPETFGNAPFQVTASSTSSGAVTYSLPRTDQRGTVTSSGLVTMTGAGTVYLTATQAASGNDAGEPRLQASSWPRNSRP